MNRQAQGVVLLLLGGAALRASLTDMHLRYVKESLQPFLVAASVLLVLGGAMTLWYDLRQEKDEAPDRGHGREDGRGHDRDDSHGHREPRVGWLLILPVLGLLLVAPPALGSYAASSAGTALSLEQRPSDFPSLPEHLDPAPLSVLDYASRAIWDEGTSLAGRRVQLTGFLITDRDGEPFLARIVLSCCAADGRPIKVGLSGDAPSGLPDDTWVEAVGTYVDETSIDPINEATIPFLRVESWREIPAPRQQYEQ